MAKRGAKKPLVQSNKTSAIKQPVVDVKQGEMSPAERKKECTIQERIMGGYMSVRFGPGLEILSVSANTKATSPAAIIENLPAGIQVEDVLLLLHQFKLGEGVDARAVRIMLRGKKIQAMIHFEDTLSADAAIRAFNGHCYKGLGPPLVARALKPTFASEDITHIELSWFPPSKAAQLLLTSSTEAEAVFALASRGKGLEIRGRRIKCLRQEPRSTFSKPYSVLVVGLDVETTEDELTKLFSCDSIKMKAPKVSISREDAESYIRSLFDNQPVNNFKLISEARESKQRAIINFETAENARQVYKKLQGTTHDFLGPGFCSLDMNLTYSATFKIPADVYVAIRDEIKMLDSAEKVRGEDFGLEKSKVKGEDAPARLRILDKYRDRPVTVHVNGNGRPAVVRVKIAIQQLLRGEVVCGEDGKALWDPALGTPRGGKLIKDVKGRIGTHVSCDIRNRCITIYGSPEKRTLAKEMLVREYKNHPNLQHEISLKENIGSRRELAAVQEYLGAEKVTIDIPRKRLLVFCSPMELENVRRILRQFITRRRGANKGKSNVVGEVEDCLICLTPAEDALKMAPCGHMYCRSCARDYIRSTTETRRYPITCVGTGDGGCNTAVSVQLIEELLSKDDADHLFEHGFTYYIQSRPQEYHFCPTPDCTTVFNITGNGRVFTCSHCFIGICTTCKTEAHEGQTCEEYQIATNPLLDEKKLQEWKKKARVKACPKCKAGIEKAGGCMHIACYCGAHICWMCLNIFDKAEDVYSHMEYCVLPDADFDSDFDSDDDNVIPPPAPDPMDAIRERERDRQILQDIYAQAREQERVIALEREARAQREIEAWLERMRARAVNGEQNSEAGD